MTYRLIFTLLMIMSSNVAFAIPEYCKKPADHLGDLLVSECEKYAMIGGKVNQELAPLEKLSQGLTNHFKKLSAKVINKELYKTSMARMLQKKYSYLSLFPELGAGGQSSFYSPVRWNSRPRKNFVRNKMNREFQACFKEDPAVYEQIEKADQRFKQDQSLQRDHSVEKKQYLATLVVSAIKAQKKWNQLPELKKKMEEQEKLLRSTRSTISNRHRWIRMKKGQKEIWLKKKEKYTKDVEQTKAKLAGLKKEILQDPMWSEATGTFEFSNDDQFDDFKPSVFLKNVMKSFKQIPTGQHSGPIFRDYLGKLIESGNEQQAALRIGHLMDVDPTFKDKINDATTKNLRSQIRDVDEGISKLCKNKAKGLAHYQEIVDDLASSHVQAALKNGDDPQKAILEFRETHCTLLKNEPVSNGLIGSLAFGGVLLVGAALIPFTGGGSLAASLMFVGGSGLATMGGIETYGIYQKYKLEKGMVHSNLISAQKMRDTLHDVRINTGLTALDVALMPLDVLATARVLVKTNKALAKADKIIDGSNITLDATEAKKLSKVSGQAKRIKRKKIAAKKARKNKIALTKNNKRGPTPKRSRYNKIVKESDSSVNAKRVETRNSREAIAFKNKYQDKYLSLRNNDFIKDFEVPIPEGKKALYFDVENSVLKKLNDVVFEDKGFGDAVGNLFTGKVHELINANPQLKSKLALDYQDYKSLRYKFLLDEGEDATKYEKMLSDVYKQANAEFNKELATSRLHPLWKGLKGQLGNPSQWFLAGVGDDALKANMATRGAREVLSNNPSGVMTSFASQKSLIQGHLTNIVDIRDSLAANKIIRQSGILRKGRSGEFLLDDTALEIVRKAETAKGDDYRINDVYSKIKKLYGVDLPEQDVIKVINYFEEIDTVSPPLFLRHRQLIPLEKAEKGIVSVDFAGIGVSNAREAMEGVNIAAAKVNKSSDWVEDGLKSIDTQVSNVTDQMGDAKKSYQDVVKRAYNDTEDIYFSGDDGIYLPKKELSRQEKIKVVNMISKENPSQFRMTFVKTTFADGSAVPTSLRSELVVKAEKLEKSIRKDIVGVSKGKIDRLKAKGIMIAVDYTPIDKVDGTFNIIVGGKVSSEELKIIKRSFTKLVKGSQKIGKVFHITKKAASAID